MKILVLMPARNEAARYLHSAISNALEWADDVFVYDDGSTDDSYEIALDAGAVVKRREESVPKFLEHEGRFRQGSWNAFTDCLSPQESDWVFAVDSDECVVTDAPLTRSVIESNIAAAQAIGAFSCIVPVPEFFGYDEDGTPMRRTDGLWATIAGTRLFRFQPAGCYADRPMGSGAEPGYVQARRKHQSSGLSLCHYGYADANDQIEKYNRYTSLKAHGHANAHVNSILATKTLERWTGKVPDMTRGDSLAIA